MTAFNPDQALARHIALSDQAEAEAERLIAEGRHSTATTALNMALNQELGELQSEAMSNGFVFRCWESDNGFVHTIEKILPEQEQPS